MNDQELPMEERLERYLDGLLDDGERIAFEAEVQRTPQLQREVHLARRIDDALRNTFRTEVNSEIGLLKDPATVNRPEDRVPANWHVWQNGPAMAVAAVLLLLSGGILWRYHNRSDHTQPFFQARPLVTIFQEELQRGYEPYYVCDDAPRFAAVFAERQGVSLALNELPADRHMLGISYLGGFSRNTTAILCEVDRRPTIVFVDKASFASMEVLAEPDSELEVHRVVRDGLVFCEVSPFSTPQIIPFLTRVP